MVFEHFRTHFDACNLKNSNNFKFGSFDGHALESILDISNESLKEINENLNKTYMSNTIPSTSREQSKSESSDLSDPDFSIPRTPIYLKKYNDTRKLRKQITNFVDDLEAKNDINMQDLILNILHVLAKHHDFEEAFGVFGYIKIQNMINYSKFLRLDIAFDLN